MNAAFWKMAKAMHEAAVLSKDYTQYARVVSQVLDAYLSNEDIRLEFDPDRNFGWGNRRSVLIAGHQNYILRFPATLIKEQWGQIYLERVKKKMNTQKLTVLLIVQTGLMGWESRCERTLRRTEASLAEFESMLESMDFDFEQELFEGLSLTFARDNEKRIYAENQGSRKISFVLSVKGPRQNEWSGTYTSLAFDLDEGGAEEAVQWLHERTKIAVEGAIKRADDYAFTALVTDATNSLLGGKYNWKWISDDSRLQGHCGGHNGWRWEFREETGELVLFQKYSGVPRGMDGTNRPWGAVLVIRVKKSGENRTFEFVVEPLDYKMKDPQKEAIRDALSAYQISN